MDCFCDNQLFANFVNPINCNYLLNAGLTPHTFYRWKVYTGGIYRLITTLFDLDDYYVDGNKAQDAINPPKMVLPAYTIKDVEKVLPEYLFTKTAGEYEISLSNLYGVNSYKSKRLPDAMAMMLEEVLRKRIIHVSKVNTMLHDP